MFTQLFQISYRINAILIAILFASIGNNAMFLLMPIYMDSGGTSTSVIGWVMSGYSMGILIGSYYGHYVISRVGHIRSYAFATSVIVIVVTAHIFFHNEIIFFILRLIIGLSMAGMYLTLESWLSATSEHHSRGMIYAMYQLFFGAGILLAPFVATWFHSYDLRSIGLIAMMFSISMIPVLLTRFASPQIGDNQKNLPLIEMLRDTPSGAVMTVLGGIAFGALASLLSLFALWLELESNQIAIMVSLAMGSSIIFQIPIGRLSDIIDERRVLLLINIIAIISILATIILTYSGAHWLLIVLSIGVLGGLLSTIYPVCVKFIYNQMDSDKAIPAMSSLMLLFSSGLIAGPIIGSQVMQFTNALGLFFFLLCVMASAGLFMLFRVVVMRKPDKDVENIPYAITLRMISPINANLDPRNDYLVTKISDGALQTLAGGIGISPAKTQKLIEQSLPLLEHFQPEEILEALVMLKPRLCKVIVRAMLYLYPDNRIEFTRVLGDLISLNKQTINRLLFEGLTHKADEETKQEVLSMFEQFLQPHDLEDTIQPS